MIDFLLKAENSGREVTVIIKNGFQMAGKIVHIDIDYYTITLDVKGEKQLVFMSAISTII